jgi:hypothetical protein
VVDLPPWLHLCFPFYSLHFLPGGFFAAEYLRFVETIARTMKKVSSIKNKPEKMGLVSQNINENDASNPLFPG